MTIETASQLELGLEEALAHQGFAFVPAERMHRVFSGQGDLHDWAEFAASWSRLERDRYMADQGRYRFRRHAVFAVAEDGTIRREAHQPHWQSMAYNPLNGGVARWFAPVEDAVANSASMAALLATCRLMFGHLSPDVKRWRVEVHQFRIVAAAGEAGLPTPEGMHRDGVDYVLVLMVGRVNVAQGTTAILDLQGRELGRFTLADPFDAAVVNDRQVYHGVTPVEVVAPASPAWRDVLVVTFSRETAARSLPDNAD